MAPTAPLAKPVPGPGGNGEAAPRKPGGRVIELDILRGFLLLWMALTHLPTKASTFSNQTFGFVSGAEGFIFLAAFMVGRLGHRMEQKRGELGAVRDLARRTVRVYLYHCALLAIAFTLVAEVGVRFHRLSLENLLSFYLHSPKPAVIAAALLEYRPSLLDILPMYVIFMALTPLARKLAQRWGWEPLIYLSFGVWAAAQFGLRAWVYRHVNLFGLGVPENSTGAFDLYAWQLLWMVGLALGSITAGSVTTAPPGDSQPKSKFPGWLMPLSFSVAIVGLVLRHSPADRWLDPNLYGWLIDKWHLGPARVINFSALAIILVRFGARIAASPFLAPLALLGQASIEVFCVHVLCCLGGVALSRDADPNLPWWQQVILLTVTLSALFLVAQWHRSWIGKKRAEARLAAK
jgi:hypothetical protein